MTQKTDPRGIVTTTSYDDLDCPLGIAYSDATPAATYTYDQGLYDIGRLSRVSNSVASTSYTCNKMGRTLQQDKTIGGISFSMSWAYNVGGQVTSYTLPNGTTISQTYDNLGRPTSITSDWVDADHPATLATNFVYHPTGALTSIEYGNGTTSTRSYTSGGLLKTLQHGTLSDPGELLDFEYDYQEGGRILGITDHNDAGKSQTYTYDGFHRLLTAETTGSHWGLSWSYDRYGNRLSQTVTKGTAPSQSLSIDSQSNRVTSWVYDQAGNTVNDGSHSYAFDANNRMTSLDDGSTLYRYDAGGSRVQKVAASQTTSYFFGVGEYDSTLGWSNLYIKLGMEKLVEYSEGTTQFFHTDHRFTPRLRSDVSGAPRQTWDDLPYGEEWQSNGGTDTHRYTGHLRDGESGNDLAGARYYSSQGGRWLGADPLRGEFKIPQTLNRFTAAKSDPVNFIDPDGRSPITAQTVCHAKVELDGNVIVDVLSLICMSFFEREGAPPERPQVPTRQGNPPEDDPFNCEGSNLNAAVCRALRIIRDVEDCSTRFKGNIGRGILLQLLVNNRFVFADLGAPVLTVDANGDEHVEVIQAQNNPLHRTIEINTRGPFEDGMVRVEGRDEPVPFWNLENLGLSLEDRRALLILHEFGHFINVIDSDSFGGSRRNNVALLKDCFGITLRE